MASSPIQPTHFESALLKSTNETSYVTSMPKMSVLRILWLHHFVALCLPPFSNKTADVLLELLENQNISFSPEADEDYLHNLLRPTTPCSTNTIVLCANRWPRRKSFVINEDVDLFERLRSQTSSMRIAMIAWLVVSSTPIRDARASAGFSDWQIWDVKGAISTWYDMLPIQIQDSILPDDHVYADFHTAMAMCRHRCLPSSPQHSGQAVRKWIAMRSWLYPGQKYSAVGYFREYMDGVQCPQCQDLQSSYLYSIPSIRELQGPPTHLVLLALIRKTLAVNEDFTYEGRVPSHLLSSSQITSISAYIRNLPRDPQDIRYLPWVNAYPSKWHRSITAASLDSTIIEATSLRTSEVGARTWIGAIILSMLPPESEETRSRFSTAMDFLNIETGREDDMDLYTASHDLLHGKEYALFNRRLTQG